MPNGDRDRGAREVVALVNFPRFAQLDIALTNTGERQMKAYFLAGATLMLAVVGVSAWASELTESVTEPSYDCARFQAPVNVYNPKTDEFVPAGKTRGEFDIVTLPAGWEPVGAGNGSILACRIASN